MLEKCFPCCLLSYKLCSKTQITLSNLHDHNRILFMLITLPTSRRVVVTSLSFTGQLSASLFLAVCVWPLPELLSECAWPLRVFLHHQPVEGLPKYLIVFIHFLCPAWRDREGEREGGREWRREGGRKSERDGERQSAERQRGRKARRDMGKKKGQKGRKRKGRAVSSALQLRHH